MPEPPRPKVRYSKALALATERAQGWMNDAACQGMDPKFFFMEHGGSDRPALAACFRCPVRYECMEYAVDNERYGIYGGTDARARKRARNGRISLDELFVSSAELWQARNEPYRQRSEP